MDQNDRLVERKLEVSRADLQRLLDKRSESLPGHKRFVLGEPLGGGNFGVVFALEGEGRRCLKVINVDAVYYDQGGFGIPLAEYRKKAERELDVMVQMSRALQREHPDEIHFVQIFETFTDCFDQDELLFIHMVRYPHSLNDLPDHFAFSEDFAIKLGMDLCQALDFLHTMEDEDGVTGYSHRDVKPENAFYQSTPRVFGGHNFYLGDFGGSRPIGNGAGSMAIWTKGYCPITEIDSVDPRRDIYALGRTLYWYCNDKELSDVRQDFVPPQNGSPWLHQILKRATELNPEERYPSARAMLADLEALCQSRQEAAQKAAAEKASLEAAKAMAEERLRAAEKELAAVAERAEQEAARAAEEKRRMAAEWEELETARKAAEERLQEAEAKLAAAAAGDGSQTEERLRAMEERLAEEQKEKARVWLRLEAAEEQLAEKDRLAQALEAANAQLKQAGKQNETEPKPAPGPGAMVRSRVARAVFDKWLGRRVEVESWGWLRVCAVTDFDDKTYVRCRKSTAPEEPTRDETEDLYFEVGREGLGYYFLWADSLPQGAKRRLDRASYQRPDSPSRAGRILWLVVGRVLPVVAAAFYMLLLVVALLAHSGRLGPIPDGWAEVASAVLPETWLVIFAYCFLLPWLSDDLEKGGRLGLMTGVFGLCLWGAGVIARFLPLTLLGPLAAMGLGLFMGLAKASPGQERAWARWLLGLMVGAVVVFAVVFGAYWPLSWDRLWEALHSVGWDFWHGLIS